MDCVVFGATGYLGMRLVPALLSEGHRVRLLARDPSKLDDVPWRDKVDVFQGDVSDADSVRTALEGQQVLYYLVHSMMRPDFVQFDHDAACTVAEAAQAAGLSRIVYVGGIIPEGQELSDHLASREEVGKLLRQSGVPTVELRAAAIIGAGSASFEMLRYLTDRLPLMVTPRWLRTCVQPIAIRDVLYYLVKSAELPAEVNRPFDIGGPDHFTYTEMIRKYAEIARLPKRLAIPAPVLSPWLSSQWVNVVTPLPRALAVSLMESLENDVVCADHDIADYLPDPEGGLTHYREAVELALSHVRDGDVRTRWWRAEAEDAPSRPLPTDPDWAGGSLYEDVRECHIEADSATVWRAVATAAAESEWSAVPRGWSLRGWVARRPRGAAQSTGTARHSLEHRELHEGESLDWWLVERIEAPRLLRLRAEFRLPGRLWLELAVRPADDGGSIYRQRAVFQPYGLAGQVFWNGLAPARKALSAGVARDVSAVARALTDHAADLTTLGK
ncbi:NAD(P)-dependent oxidoreductase [Mycobacterium intermedium]|uniref:NAD(P)-dependent oxidoreductase n=1 Tax=Mycobacterium intermedium TaxID=28445 RepID=A0A1E3S888_MYCIE|nr:DUF2867 domain-containing protein [Mycobacterium intermedium]MCV6964176.1 DUF2867 domain-containing protein [Mycobacterium intermedium]ODQ98320.1 NAD(P)-dependent oxidoreductase [Mycobacterium intermedium]OPE47731.1 NAD(P)-dependent oxidoreductase [Mycobacterium intermedium]ORB03357.1 NAD(P)-dependent oxidoreductase [Mycobacterium intermedium]